MASSLSGLKLNAQTVRGISLSTTHGANDFTVMLGQLSGKKTGLIGVPSVLAFTGTLHPSSRVAFAPRVVTHLGSSTRPGSADTSVGAGVRAALSSHVTLIGDIAGARTTRGHWAPSVVVGSVGKWSRGPVEASLRRADSAYTLMGRIPAAAQNQESLKGKLTVVRGFTLLGQLTTSRPRGPRPEDAGRMTQTLTFKIDRVGTLQLTRKQGTRGSRRTDERQLQFEFKGSPGERVSLSGRTSVWLSELAPDRSRVRSRLKGRVAVGGRLELTAEAEYDLFGTRAAAASIGQVRLGGDIALSDRTTLHLVYSRDPHTSAPRSQRLEGRISRLVSF